MLGDYHLPNLTLPTEEESDKFKFIGTIEFIQCIQFLLSANKHQHTSEDLVIYDLLNYNQLKIDCQ